MFRKHYRKINDILRNMWTNIQLSLDHVSTAGNVFAVNEDAPIFLLDMPLRREHAHKIWIDIFAFDHKIMFDVESLLASEHLS